MSKKIYCPECTGEMKMVSKKTTEGKRGNKFRIRKFKCTVCDHEEAVYADGTIDEILEPEKAKKQINKLYKQEEKARE